MRCIFKEAAGGDGFGKFEIYREQNRTLMYTFDGILLIS